jgi:hypothetical protein
MRPVVWRGSGPKRYGGGDQFWHETREFSAAEAHYFAKALKRAVATAGNDIAAGSCDTKCMSVRRAAIALPRSSFLSTSNAREKQLLLPGECFQGFAV